MQRSMKGDIAAVALLLHLATIPGSSAQTGAGEAPWIELENDPSRTELFDVMIKPTREQRDASAPSNPVDLAIPKIFYFPTDARTDVIKNKPREGALFGIDISHYTRRDLDHTALRFQEIRFVYIKATQGVGFKDGAFDFFWTKLHALDPARSVSVGAYHFLTAGEEGKDQAKRFVAFIAQRGGLMPSDMPPCLDLEWDRTATNPDRWTSVSAEDAVRNAVDWLEYVEQHTGRRPMLYTAKAWLDGRNIHGELFAKLAKYPIWIADYSETRKLIEKPAVPVGITPVLWQFASDAHVTDGYKGVLDANVFYGTEAEFVAAFGLDR